MPRQSVVHMKKRALVGLLCAATLAGCAGGSVRGTGGAGSCAFLAQFRGTTYEEVRLGVAAPEGEPVGTATLPPCNDTGGDDEQGEEIEVARLEGVPPRQALLWVGHPDEVLVREGLKPYPDEITRLLEPPACDPRDEPIQLTGTWLGILGADGNTEVDMKPPYDVDMFVEESSKPTYERAYLTVRVPKTAGQPLSRDDLRESLWEGGTVSVEARCSLRGYVATEISAAAPTD